MKKKITSSLLLLVITAMFAGAAFAAIHNPKMDADCYNKDGVFVESKTCDPASCGCLFHRIEEYIKDYFD